MFLVQSLSLTTLGAGEAASLQKEVAAQLAGSETLLEAAQRFVAWLDEQFKNDLTLARLYATVPLRGLAGEDRSFVRRLLPEGRVTPSEDMLALSLLGTAGMRPEWNVRTLSRGHLAIPLAGSAAVGAIPMVARLLTDFGINLADLDDPGIATRRFAGGLNGLFYVEDARTAKDREGRLIIPAQDFVEAYGVRTVFGMGGSYLGGTLVAGILFCRQRVARREAELCASLITAFKTATTRQVGFGRIFA